MASLFRIGARRWWSAWIVFFCLLATGGVASRVPQGDYQEPIPEHTVDAAISQMVYQGGTVVLRVSVAADGAVSGIDVIKPMAALTEPVVAAVKQWRFKPARRNGRAVEAKTTVAVQVVMVRTSPD